jgi:hypothetical protein
MQSRTPALFALPPRCSASVSTPGLYRGCALNKYSDLRGKGQKVIWPITDHIITSVTVSERAGEVGHDVGGE